MVDEKNLSEMTPEEAFELGKEYYDGKNGKKRDYEKTIECYKIAAAAGLVAAQRELGRMYYWGYGVDADVKIALYWFEKAASGGDVDSKYMAGLCYEDMSGPFCHDEAMLGMAKYCFEEAAKEGHELAKKEYKRYKKKRTNISVINPKQKEDGFRLVLIRMFTKL